MAEGKYQKLNQYLRNLPANMQTMTLSFEQIEAILENPLPPAAHEYNAWWANQANPHQPQKIAIKTSGWRTQGVNLKGQEITFVRTGIQFPMRTDLAPIPPTFTKTIGKYELLEILGEGGFGTVYRALDRSLNREVALKVLLPQWMFNAGIIEKFKKEAQSLANLNHPNIVQVFELGEDAGRVFIAMRYLSGGSLKSRLDAYGKLGWREATAVIQQIGQALRYAHGKGLIHRDIKPGNILFSEEGEAVLTDFGLAHAMQASGAATTSMAGIGTPEYIAPEQATQTKVDLRADIYSLGITLYEMVTGKKPFEGDTPFVIIDKHLHTPLPDPVLFTPDLPAAFKRVLLQATAKAPEERYQNIHEFLTQLLLVGSDHIETDKRTSFTTTVPFSPTPVTESQDHDYNSPPLLEEIKRQLNTPPSTQILNTTIRNHPLAVGSLICGIIGLIMALFISFTFFW